MVIEWYNVRPVNAGMRGSEVLFTQDSEELSEALPLPKATKISIQEQFQEQLRDAQAWKLTQ